MEKEIKVSMPWWAMVGIIGGWIYALFIGIIVIGTILVVLFG